VKLIHDAQKYGARVALFGRKINHAEHQLAFIEMLRLITDGRITPEEAVRAYHGVLQSKGIKPQRALADDLQSTDQAVSYDGSAARRSTVQLKQNPLAKADQLGETETGGYEARKPCADEGGKIADWPKLPDGSPDFVRMNSAQRRAYDSNRLNRKFGERV
jgi:hypothetical protein